MKRRKKSSTLKPHKDYVVFDIETDLIPKNIPKHRRTHAIKKLRVKLAWAYSSATKKYTFFTVETLPALVKMLYSAKQVVGFNVIDFDYKVLYQHGLKRDRVHNKTIDLFAIIRKETKNWYSLDKLAHKNLGRGKITNSNLKAYCKNDVRITRDLFKLWSKSKLEYDRFQWERNAPIIDDAYVDVEIDFHNAPKTCIHCGSVNIRVLEPDFEEDDLTDGQLADQMAGFGGTSHCVDCGAIEQFE